MSDPWKEKPLFHSLIHSSHNISKYPLEKNESLCPSLLEKKPKHLLQVDDRHKYKGPKECLNCALTPELGNRECFLEEVTYK